MYFEHDEKDAPFIKVPSALLYDERIPAKDRANCFLLMAYIRDHQKAWSFVLEKMLADLPMSENVFYRCRRHLIRCGYLIVREKRRPDGTKDNPDYISVMNPAHTKKAMEKYATPQKSTPQNLRSGNHTAEIHTVESTEYTLYRYNQDQRKVNLSNLDRIDKESKEKFARPSEQAVIEHALKTGSTEERAREFFNYQQKNEWIDQRTGKPIMYWQKAFDGMYGGSPAKPPAKASNVLLPDWYSKTETEDTDPELYNRIMERRKQRKEGTYTPESRK